MILEDRKTAPMSLCMLGKSSVVTAVREEAVEEDEDDEVVEEGRVGLNVVVPRLMLARG